MLNGYGRPNDRVAFAPGARQALQAGDMEPAVPRAGDGTAASCLVPPVSPAGLPSVVRFDKIADFDNERVAAYKRL